ncbi:hypothetical protein BGZ91_000380 [Linnemannia elongata]|nr:hypothetical protein BGZ91_000380 [Linnemannia elongata]KAG0075659.1 hypothetical protein BGZ90_009638 [Linnemannia elongata]
MPATHALEIPEILANVGRFLPLWTVVLCPRRVLEVIRFRPHTLHSCSLVSKVWRSTLIPILWHTYDNVGMEYVPQEVIARYSLHFKKVYVRDHDPGNLHCTNLVELHLSSLSPISPMMSVDAQRQLILANPRLRILHWGCSPATNNTLDPDDFAALKNIEHLGISDWNVSGGALGNTLKGLAGSLTKLSVFKVRGAEDGILSIIPTGVDDNGNTNTVSGELMRDNDTLVLPIIRTIFISRAPPFGPQPADLVRHCPNLRNLSVALGANTDLDRLSKTIRTHCPTLDALYLLEYGSSTNKVDRSSRLIMDTFGSGPGKLATLCLTLIEAGPRLISAILLNASALENLKITYVTRTIDMDGVLTLLRGCSELKVFTLSMQGRPCTDIDIINKVDKLGSKPWGCGGLKKFELHISGDHSRGKSNETTGEAEDEDWVGFDVASLISRTHGWCLHHRKSNYQGVDSSLWNKDYMRRLFKLVNGLERLDHLIVGGMMFSCVHRPVGLVAKAFTDGM